MTDVLDRLKQLAEGGRLRWMHYVMYDTIADLAPGQAKAVVFELRDLFTVSRWRIQVLSGDCELGPERHGVSWSVAPVEGKPRARRLTAENAGSFHLTYVRFLAEGVLRDPDPLVNPVLAP